MALTKTNAIKMSLRKWHKILDAYPDIKKMWDVEKDNDCGFCNFFFPGFNFLRCNSCPLYPDVCYKIMGEEPLPLYWQIRRKFYNRELNGLRDMIEQMIKEIQERGEKWLKLKKQ